MFLVLSGSFVFPLQLLIASLFWIFNILTACYEETLGVLNASFLNACFSGFRKLSYNAIGWVLYSFVPSVFCPTPCGLFSLVPWSYIRVLRLCRDAHSLTDLVDAECCILTICPPSWCPFFWTLLSVLSTVLFI